VLQKKKLPRKGQLHRNAFPCGVLSNNNDGYRGNSKARRCRGSGERIIGVARLHEAKVGIKTMRAGLRADQDGFQKLPALT
jgi:hypothetical protein